MVDKAERLISTTSPFGGHGAQLVSFLEQARGQYVQIVRFYESNHAMLNYFWIFWRLMKISFCWKCLVPMHSIHASHILHHCTICIHIIIHDLNNHNVSNIGHSGNRKESSKFFISTTPGPRLRKWPKKTIPRLND